MKGKIKFVDGRKGTWGWIIPEDGKGEVFFHISDFIEERPARGDTGREVEFEVESNAKGRNAKKIKLGAPLAGKESAPSSDSEPLGGTLTRWAFIPLFIPFTHWKTGIRYTSALEYLAGIALSEKWHFGETPNPKYPYPILGNYLAFTFYKLQRDGKVLEKGDWATFNTGLVDKLYEPIFALFATNRSGPPHWYFLDFCVPGVGPAGKRLTSLFNPLPEHAKYFDKSFELVLDTTQPIYADYDHIITDGVARGRFPSNFLEQHRPEGFEWRNPEEMAPSERFSFLGSLSKAIDGDVECKRRIKRRLEDAKEMAEKRTRWNFKTAIPIYHPRRNEMSLLLPLSLVGEDKVDVALVVTKNESGSYQGRTVLPLGWAYKNARLVCRPDSDWLTPNLILEAEQGTQIVDEDSDESPTS